MCRDGIRDCAGQGKYTCGETCCYTQDDCINGARCLPGRACAGEWCPEDEECMGGDTCCPIERIGQGVCCEPGAPCVDHAGWVVILVSPDEQTFYGKTLGSRKRSPGAWSG